MGYILSLLLALSLSQTEAENASQAQEANKIINEQQVRIEMLSQRVERLEKEKKQLIHNKKSEASKISTEVEQYDSNEYETFKITAYTNGAESTGKDKGHPLYGIQANGERTVEGESIACPKSMDFGTKIYIKELNHTYTCSDRGGAIKEGMLDIYIEDLEEALEFGEQWLSAKVMKEGA